MVYAQMYRDQIAAELHRTTARRLDSYFKVYDDLIARSDVYVLQIQGTDIETSSPITHGDVLLAARILRGDPTLTLEQASIQLGQLLERSQSTPQLRTTILISVRAMLMIDSAEPTNAWKADEEFVQYISRSFHRAGESLGHVSSAMQSLRTLKAWKLKSRCNICFRGTDTLTRHLFLDQSHPDGPVLYIFHYTAFLKAQLGSLRDGKLSQDCGLLLGLQSGCLPPRLVIETLHSIQSVLFHFDDHKSRKILSSLISKDGFDEDCMQAEGYSLIDNTEPWEYLFWGERLAALHDFVQYRPPRNSFERWMKWQTSEGNAFAVALAALLISILVGILSLGLGALQAWLAWKAWREPISDGDEKVIRVEDLIEWLEQQRRDR